MGHRKQSGLSEISLDLLFAPSNFVVSTMNYPYRITFRTMLSSLEQHHGKQGEVTSIIAEPNDGYDMACLPLFNVRLDDGSEIVAAEDEIHCEQTYSAVKQWCMEHLDEIAYRGGTTIEQAKQKIEESVYDPREYADQHPCYEFEDGKE
jgi:hypothetical protein